jgi:hypothetical protein
MAMFLLPRNGHCSDACIQLTHDEFAMHVERLLLADSVEKGGSCDA